MSEKKEMVGMDRKFCPVYVGDTIIDASGVKYTISERGTCVNAAGKDYAFSDLHGPELCAEEQKPVAVAEPTPEVKLLPKRKGGKENKSGLVSLGSLARRLHVKQAGLARTLRAGGIDVVKGKNGYGIRVADVEKAEQLLAPLKAALPKEKKPEKVEREANKQEVVPAVDFGLLGVEAIEVRPMEEDLDAWRLNGFSDQELADALRYRGYEVTATKTVVVSL
mgnify:CR=1 FL=1